MFEVGACMVMGFWLYRGFGVSGILLAAMVVVWKCG